MPGTKMPKSPMIMMHPDMPVMRFANGSSIEGVGENPPSMEEISKRWQEAIRRMNKLEGEYTQEELDELRAISEGNFNFKADKPVQEENSFDMLRMFMELTPEEKMIVAGPNFNEMTEDEVGMAMYNFIYEGRSLTGGREVDYMDPDKQGLANGGIVSLMGG
tara:strand:+ start:3126 stop:3611 length:486 start_codon:yes stop_codon:yes gene_type:complete